MLVPSGIEGFLHELKRQGVRVAGLELSEEEQSFPMTFLEERVYASVEAESWKPLEVTTGGTKINFAAFLDGVQRTMMLPYRIPLPNGAQVPLHVAHIAAGVFLRDESGCLYIDPDLITARLLLLGPFHGIQEAGGLSVSSADLIWDTSDQTFDFPSEPNEWVVCDTTFHGTEEDRGMRLTGALLGEELFKEGLVRARAQGRVATLRQRLEFAVLAKFRQRYADAFILVDGPLFFLDKWRRKAAKILGSYLGQPSENCFEDVLLKNAVGLIKTHRLRPRHPEQILKIGPGQRSPVVRITEEVDIKGRRGELDEEGGYGGAHLTWYTRLYFSEGDIVLTHGLYGLVRLDVHRTTLGIERADTLNPESFRVYKDKVDEITQAVWRERWPVVRRGGESGFGTQIYPVEQLEKVLKAGLYPRRLLAYLCNLTESRVESDYY
ncbi:hypothetical protein [Candidatus Hadarchaeum sp.]|uniref:hypothetical protein n=1 Tax=Candidatus Hadarchaeum sp. TaxID=2883567 RepID=UPI00319E8F77